MWLIEQYLGTNKTLRQFKAVDVARAAVKTVRSFRLLVDRFFHYVDLRVKINRTSADSNTLRPVLVP